MNFATHLRVPTLRTNGVILPFPLYALIEKKVTTLPLPTFEDESGSFETPEINILDTQLNLQAPCVLYIGQAFRYSSENAFCLFNQQIYFII
jgi:hypothetical protein